MNRQQTTIVQPISVEQENKNQLLREWITYDVGAWCVGPIYKSRVYPVIVDIDLL